MIFEVLAVIAALFFGLICGYGGWAIGFHQGCEYQDKKHKDRVATLRELTRQKREGR